MKFLIVDDSLAMQAIIRLNLERAGYKGNEFQAASDGVAALKVIEDWQPDIVLTDWHMPNMTGLELIKAIQERGLTLKIGLLTTETNPQLLDEAMEAGALFVLHKPFELEELEQTLTPFIGGSSSKKAIKKSKGVASEKQQSVALPSIAALNKLAQGMLSKAVSVERSSSLAINYNHLPYVISLFCSSDHTSIKAMSVMDIRAAAMLCCLQESNPKKAMEKIQKTKALTDEQQQRLEGLMGAVSTLFVYPSSRETLEVKGVHVVAKQSEQLDRLGATSKDKRLDLVLKVDQLGEGQVILMAVAEK